jgi:peroxiredoxin family protein
MSKTHYFPELQEYVQLKELQDLAVMAKSGIEEGNYRIQLCKDYLKESNIANREELLDTIQKLQQHVYVCQSTLGFFQHEIQSLSYLLN